MPGCNAALSIDEHVPLVSEGDSDGGRLDEAGLGVHLHGQWLVRGQDDLLAPSNLLTVTVAKHCTLRQNILLYNIRLPYHSGPLT